MNILAEREADWADRLERLRDEQERQAARHAAREAAQAAREAELVARLDERGRVIDRLTAHIAGLSLQAERDRLALEQAHQAVADLEARLAESQRRVESLTARRLRVWRRRPA
jgi:hypothetical protein